MGKLYVGNSGSTPAIIKVKNKFGASADTWIGDVDENGTLNSTTWTGSLNFAGVKTIGNSALDSMFRGFTGITSVDLSSLQSVDEKGLYYTFEDCTSITGALDLSSLITVGARGLYRTFTGCTGITSVDLSSLQSVGDSGMFYTFQDCTSITGTLDLSSLQNVGGSGLRYAFHSTGITSVDLSSLQSVGDWGLAGAFGDCMGITSVDLSFLQSVGDSGLHFAFSDCTGITSVDLSSLQSVDDSGLYFAFSDCTSITGVDLSSLQSVGDSGMYSAFNGCTSLTNIDFSSLQDVGDSGMSNAFYGCEGLTTISFPSLISVQTSSFGTLSSNYAFRNCTNLKEIHFLEFMQATIEALDGYEYYKFGAENATIYFDLNNEEFPTINIIASQDVLIEINGKRTNVISAPINTQLTIKAEKEGYLTLTLTHVVSESCDIQITDDMFIPIPSEYNINYNNMNDNLLLLSSLVDGSNFIISDELCGIVNGDSSFNKNKGYSSGKLAICPLSDCTLSITCEVSSENNYDFGAIYVGDSYYTPIIADIKYNKVPENIIKLFSGSGIITSQTYTTQLNANQTYIISFVYAKDTGTNSNKDRMIITEIKTEPISV